MPKKTHPTTTVLITRPGVAGETLCHALSIQGLNAIHCPVIAFAPPPDAFEFQQNLKKLAEQDWIIFISPHAVQAIITALSDENKKLLSTAHIAAIGAGTAQRLREHGYHVSAYPKQNWNSEGLLALPEFSNVVGKKITIIRGVGGRVFLESSLRAQGAQVTAVVAYRRVLPQIEMESFRKMMLSQQINVIFCSSYEGVENLIKLFGQALWPQLKILPLIVVSERIKKLAENLGFSTIWVARNTSHEEISQILRREGMLCQNNH